MAAGFTPPPRPTSKLDARVRRMLQANAGGGTNSDYVIAPSQGRVVIIAPETVVNREILSIYTQEGYNQGSSGYPIFSIGSQLGVPSFVIRNPADGTIMAEFGAGGSSIIADAFSIWDGGSDLISNVITIEPHQVTLRETSDSISTPDTGYGCVYLRTVTEDSVTTKSLGVKFANGTDVVLAYGDSTSPARWIRPGVLREDHASSGSVSVPGSVQQCSAGGITLTLATDLLSYPCWVVVFDYGGNAGSSAITIATEGSETINGAASIQLTANYEAVWLYNDGSNWFGWRMPGA